MQRSAKTRAIGWFVSAGLLVLTAGIAMLSSGTLFRDSERFVVVFDESIKGLAIGSRVTIQGVPRGEVTDIQVVYSQALNKFVLPVFFEIAPVEVALGTEKGIAITEASPQVHEEIFAGGRAKLVPQSLVTGQLMIELEVNPSVKGRIIDINSPVPQIPLMPSALTEAGDAVNDVLKQLQAVDFPAIAQNLEMLLASLNTLVTSSELTNTMQQLSAASSELNRFLNTLNQELPATQAQLNQTMNSVEKAADSFVTLATDSQDLLPEFRHALRQLDQTLGQTEETMREYQNLVSEDSELKYQAGESMRELQRAMRSLSELTDALQQQPESLIFGK